jgi:Protein of unknown function (DUF3567)
MHMLYNSESFAVVLFEVPGDVAGRLGPDREDTLTHGGYEIVDKFARKEIFIQGALAESFKEGVEALIETRPSEDEMDAYIERFSSLMQQPVILH